MSMRAGTDPAQGRGELREKRPRPAASPGAPPQTPFGLNGLVLKRRTG